MPFLYQFTYVKFILKYKFLSSQLINSCLINICVMLTDTYLRDV